MGKNDSQNATTPNPGSTTGKQQTVVTAVKKTKKSKTQLQEVDVMSIKQIDKPQKVASSKRKTLASTYFNASSGFSNNIKQEIDALAAGKVKTHLWHC